jgi:hypothetical protein
VTEKKQNRIPHKISKKVISGRLILRKFLLSFIRLPDDDGHFNPALFELS